MDCEIKFSAELSQEGNIAAAFVAENEIGTDADTSNPTKVAGELTNERFASLFAESEVESKQQERIIAEGFNDADLLRQRVDQSRRAIRCNYGVRVLIKRQDQGKTLMLARIADGLPDNLLMPKMHAVKEADGEADFPVAGLHFGCGVDEIHTEWRLRL